MHIIQSRRDFLTSLSAASVAGILGARIALAEEPPPEVTTLRLRRDPSICVAPWYIAEDLLRAEGFTDVRYVPAQSGPIFMQRSRAASSISPSLMRDRSSPAWMPACR
jgi:NitT/TauT family transport system substrate-binding protein